MSDVFMIGTESNNLVTLESLGVSDPAYSFKPHSKYFTLGDGSVRGGGWSEVIWSWGEGSNDYITTEQRDILRTFCPDASAEVFIKTRVNDADESGSDGVSVFQAVMIWPQEEERDYHTRRNFVIKFQRLVNYDPLYSL